MNVFVSLLIKTKKLGIMIQIKVEVSMQYRQSIESDIPSIMHIIHQAQTHLKEAGVNQWQNQYPNEDAILNDIHNQESYVVLDNERVIGTFALSFRIESTYNQIYEGNWLSIQDYAVIHRIALDNEFKGLGVSTEVINSIEKWCVNNKIFSIKIDTHEDNKSMRKMLEKNGFVYCGIIFLLDGNSRVAYEKLLT
jgi:RimJ/RimL family protein N-acetyltransferase